MIEYLTGDNNFVDLGAVDKLPQLLANRVWVAYGATVHHAFQQVLVCDAQG